MDTLDLIKNKSDNLISISTTITHSKLISRIINVHLNVSYLQLFFSQIIFMNMNFLIKDKLVHV